MSAPRKTALLLGATGLVGGHCLRLLLESNNYDEVITVGRRPPGIEHEFLNSRVGDLSRIETLLEDVSAEAVYCCLGTTIRKAGSRPAFEFVDLELPLRAARCLQSRGLEHFLVVTAMGANADSPIYYNRVKGRLERELAALGLPALSIFRPSLLTGSRAESRPLERAGIVAARCVDFALVGPLRNYRSIAGRDVAAAMVRKGLAGGVGHRVYLSGEIHELARY